jgi:hypothetical protein
VSIPAIRTRHAYAEVGASGTVASTGVDLTALEKLVLKAVAYFQPGHPCRPRSWLSLRPADIVSSESPVFGR